MPRNPKFSALSIQQLREKRGAIYNELKALKSKADAEKRDLTGEEDAKFKQMFADQDELRAEVQVREEELRRDEQLNALGRELDGGGGGGGSDPTGPGPRAEPRVHPAVDRELRWRPELHPGSRRRAAERVVAFAGKASSPEYRAAFQRYLVGGSSRLDQRASNLLEQGTAERRAIQADSAPDGGYLQAPPQMLAGLLRAVEDEVLIRRYATVHFVPTAASLGVLTEDASLDEFEWTSEIGDAKEDENLKFGKRELFPQPLSKLIKVSRKLLRASTMDVEGIINARAAYKYGVTEEKAFLTGNGVKKPLGLFVASDDGIPASRDISAGHTSGTALGADHFIRVKYSLKSQYQPNARWLFHRDIVMNICLLKDGEGRYIWKPGLEEGSPDMLLGKPILMSEWTPNVIASGLYIGLYGDLSYYHIVDALNMEVQVLTELYSRTNQNGYIFRREVDAMPVSPGSGEAFTRCKMP